MTSAPTHAATIAYFEKHECFGLRHVKFFQQGVIPAFYTDGRVLLSPNNLFVWGANGNGGVYKALAESGMLDDMRAKGVVAVNIYAVDNILNLPCDPMFMGCCLAARVETAAKSVPKASPDEKIGVFALANGRPRVCEYSELPAELAATRNAEGQLALRQGNICNHYFTVDALTNIAQQSDKIMPFHVARKKVACLDEQGNPVTPSAPNAIKLEMFIFDAIPACKSFLSYEVNRETDFAPVKNAQGSDSPVTALALVSGYWRSHLAAAGVTIAGDGIVEYDWARSYNGEGLEIHGGGPLSVSPMAPLLLP
jgi:UDP-N-acetylglucosamine/UDP-N-acetylgalactosamine diphosphorylase